MPRVLISDALNDQAVEIFKVRGVDVDVKTGLTPEELQKIIGDYDGLAVRSSTKVKQDIIDRATKLKVVGRAGIGVDNIDVPAATAKGVVVMNTPFGNSITTAEHAIAMMFALAREIPQAHQSTAAGKWEKSRFMGVELTGKILGVIGCGNIGAIVADRAVGLKMRVLAFDPFLSDERAQDLGVQKVDLEAVLLKSDFITVHTPLNDKTRGLLNKDAIAKMKKGVRLINCARGGIIDEDALYDALKSGHVAGAALDVFAVEPATDNKLFTLDNVVCTPHLGAATTEAQENVAIQVAEQMADFLTTGAITNALNMPSLTAEDAIRLNPYITLAEQLGSLAGQITENGLQEIEIAYEGEIAELNVKPLTSIILKAILSPLLDSVNVVNAPIVAKERNIKVTEAKANDAGDYHTLIRVTVKTDQQTRSIAGSLFGGRKPRLVNLEGVTLEVAMSPHMLFVRNNDKPGFIGRLGTVIGQAGVNIASFDLGRKDGTDRALALISLDESAPQSLIDSIAQLPDIVQVKALQF